MNIAILTILSVLLYITYQVRYEKKIKNEWLRVAINVTLTFLVIPICTNLMSTHFQAEKNRKDEEFQRMMIDAQVKGALNPEDIKSILAQAYTQVFKASEKDAEEWAKNLPSEIPIKRVQLENAKKQSETLTEKFILKWEPLVAYILNQFDFRIDAVNRITPLVIEKKANVPLITTEAESPTQEQVRIVKFPNHRGIYIRQLSGNVVNGRLAEPLRLLFEEQVSGGGSEAIIDVLFLEDRYQINTNSSRYPDLFEEGKRELPSAKDPLLTDEFRQNLIGGMTKFIEMVLLKSGSPVESSTV